MRFRISATVAAGSLLTLALLVAAVRSSWSLTASPAGAFTAVSPSPTSESVPPEVQAELDALPSGTVIVPCMGNHPRLPDGIRPQRQLGFYLREPAFRYLSDGYCANDPNATPVPLTVPVVDGPPGQTVTLP